MCSVLLAAIYHIWYNILLVFARNNFLDQWQSEYNMGLCLTTLCFAKISNFNPINTSFNFILCDWSHIRTAGHLDDIRRITQIVSIVSHPKLRHTDQLDTHIPFKISVCNVLHAIQANYFTSKDSTFQTHWQILIPMALWTFNHRIKRYQYYNGLQ